MADYLKIKTASGYETLYDSFPVDIPVRTGVYEDKDVTINAAGTVTVSPSSGYDALRSVDITTPAGVQGTPTATKGSVSNNSVSVTPSCTDTSGYVTGTTKTGNAVTVTAGELVSGTKSITSNGTSDVTNYASVNVNVNQSTQSKSVAITDAGSTTVTPDAGYVGMSSVAITTPAGTVGTPVATKSAVSNRSVTVTPSCTVSEGYIESGTSTGTPVTVTAAELISGTYSITENGTYNVANYSSAVVAVSGGGDINGSLIVCNISSNINAVIATISDYTKSAYISNNVAYIVIPYEYTGTCTLTGYVDSEAAINTTVNITTIDKYTANLIISNVIYEDGVWNPTIGAQTLTLVMNDTYGQGGTNTAELQSDNIYFLASNGSGSTNYRNIQYRLNAPIQTYGHTTIRFTFNNTSGENMKCGYYTDGTSTGIAMSGYSTASYPLPSTLDVDISGGASTIYLGFGCSTITGTYASCVYHITKIEFV